MVSPSPHPEQVTPLWHDFTRKIMADPEAVMHLGWVRHPCSLVITPRPTPRP